jgi:hypothetical protein
MRNIQLRDAQVARQRSRGESPSPRVKNMIDRKNSRCGQEEKVTVLPSSFVSISYRPSLLFKRTVPCIMGPDIAKRTAD